MECRNCGSPILEGDRFCSKCGTRVSEELRVEMVHSEALRTEAMNSEASRTETLRAEMVKAIPLCIPEEVPSRSQGLWKSMLQGKKAAVDADRSKRRISRGIAVILAAAVVLLIADSAKLVNSYHRNFSTPEEYYRWVDRRAIHKNAKTFAEYYANYFMGYLRGYDSRTSGEIRLELGNAEDWNRGLRREPSPMRRPARTEWNRVFWGWRSKGGSCSGWMQSWICGTRRCTWDSRN